MKPAVRYFVIFFSFFLCEASKFRCDYTYHPDGNGWFKLHTEAKTWSEAMYTCYLEGAELTAPYSDGIKDAMMLLIYEKNDVLTVHTARHPPATSRTLVEEEEAIALNVDGSDRRVSQNEYLPFICRKVAQEDVHLNECGTLDDAYILDNRTGHCYKFHETHVTWYKARHVCEIEDGQLAIINSDLESQVIRDIFTRNPANTVIEEEWSNMAFIGFSSTDCVSWKTLDGVTLKQAGFDIFSAGEPNNARGDEFCGSVGRNGLLFDDPCTRRMPFICEKEINSDCNLKSSNPWLSSLKFGPAHKKITRWNNQA